MAVSWTQHRFSGGVLALDTANTVVHRGDAARSFDRFDDPGGDCPLRRRGVSAFAPPNSAAGGLRSPTPQRSAPLVLAIREATDRLFRGRAVGRHGRGTSAGASCAPAPPASTQRQARSALPRHAVRRSVAAARLRGGAGRFGAVAAVGRQSRQASRSARTAAGCFSTRAATPAASGATWRSAATATRRSGTITAAGQPPRPERQRSTLARLPRRIVAWLAGARRPAATAAGKASCSQFDGKLFEFNYRLGIADLCRHARPAAADGRGQGRGRALRGPGRRRADRSCARRSGRSCATQTLDSPPLTCVVKDRPYAVADPHRGSGRRIAADDSTRP